MVALTLAIPIILTILIVYVFNPYMSFEPKDEFESWTTRERSFGYPYYWRARFEPGFIEDKGRLNRAFNRDYYKRCNWRNVMLIS
jgi:hypothetical protein